MGKERREHERITFEQSGEALIRQRLNIELVNLSAGGMGLKANLPLEIDSVCDLVLFKGNLSVEAHVRSCARVQRKKPKYRIGVRFTKVSAQLLDEVLEMEKRIAQKEARILTAVQQGNYPVAVFTFPEHLTALDNEEMMKGVQTHLDDDIRHFVIDFAGVNEMDDAFLAQLVEIDEEIRYEDGVIIMANSSSQLLCTRQVAELATLIPIFETVGKAVSSINSDQYSPKQNA
jgi:anti-anti-sigma regulatory factor